MAGKQVNFEVNVDAADAIADFKKVGKEAERAGKAIEKGLEVSPDTGKIDKFITNLKQAGEEAENVAKAVGQVKKFAPEVDDSDIAGMVLALRKAGVEFDAVEAKAKELGDALKQVDSPRVKDLDTNMRTASGGADQLTRSVGGSRSVLANMVGNATQDLGALGGIAESAGVAIGQMGEYMADAALEGEGMGSVIKNFAKVVGPVAAISVAIGVATAAVSAHKKAQQELAENVRQATEAFVDGVGSVDDWREAIEEAFAAGTVDDALAFSEQIHSALEKALEPKQLEDLQIALADLGLTFEDLGSLAQTAAPAFGAFAADALIAEGASEGMASALGPLVDTLGSAEEVLIELRQRLLSNTPLLDEFGEAVPIDETIEFVEANKDMINSLDEVEEGFNRVDLEKAAEKFLKLEASISPATRELVELARVNNDLIGGTFGVPEDAIKSFEDYLVILRTINAIQGTVVDVQEQHNEKVTAAEEALVAASEAAKEHAAAQEELAVAVAEANTELSSAASRADGWAAAMDRLNEASELTAGAEINDFVDGLEGMNEALGKIDLSKLNAGEIDLLPPPDDWQAWLNMPEEAQGVIDAMSGFREQIQSEMGQAFEARGAEGAIEWANKTRVAVVDSLKAMGITSEDAIKQILSALGLLPDQVTTQINISQAEQALAVIDSIVTGLGDIPPQIAADIQVAVNNQDPAAALQIINDYLVSVGEEPVVVNIAAEPTNVEETKGVFDKMAAEPRTAEIGSEAPDAENTSGELDDVAEPRTAEFNLSILQLLVTNLLLDAVAKDRTADFFAIPHAHEHVESTFNNVARDRDADIWVRLPNDQSTENALEFLARDRHSNIIVHTVGGGGGGGGGGGPGPGTLSAGPEAAGLMTAPMSADGELGTATPMSISPVTMAALPAAPVTNHFHTTVKAAVIGNQHDVERAVAKALRGYARLNGTRN